MTSFPEQSNSSDWERLATNLRVEAALTKVLEVLDGLPVTVFKGPLLTRAIYGDLRRRASADNDLYVPASHILEAADRLLAAGYRAAPAVDVRRVLGRGEQVDFWPQGDFDHVAVDLHSRPFSRPYFDVPDRLVEEHIEMAELQGRAVPTFDRPLAFAQMVAHFVQHHLDRQRLAPIAAAWQRWSVEMQSGSAKELFRKTCSLEAIQYALHVARGHRLIEAPFDLDLPRARQVVAVWGPLRDTRFGPPRDVVRKALSLYLVAPDQMLPGVAQAALLDSDELTRRYGSGPRALLTARHLLSVLRRG